MRCAPDAALSTSGSRKIVMQPDTKPHPLTLLDKCALCLTVIPVHQALISSSGEIICAECERSYLRRVTKIEEGAPGQG